MQVPNPLPSAEDSLPKMTESARKTPVIDWYRTPIPKEEFRKLHERNDWAGFVQTGGYLAILVAVGGGAIAAWAAGAAWWMVVLLVFCYGMVASFLINGVHELGHGTVFKTRRYNSIFVHILAFLGWINHEQFNASHVRHHRYTLHPPDDLEVVLPIHLMARHFFLNGFIRPSGFWYSIRTQFRYALGRFQGEWENTLFPKDQPEVAAPTIRWARILLLGHGCIAVVSISLGWWIIPVVISLGPFCGGWLFFLCNNTQHVGLRDFVPDFRLCCRTFTLNPLARFLYWQMNYHTEHHMYAAVPCYNLPRLHQLIRHDLPYVPKGIWQVWKEILTIQYRVAKNPEYVHPIELPQTAAPARLAA